MLMPKDVFRFKQFEVRHARSSMRVSTDAVLLGAWAWRGMVIGEAPARILDIGCGCGLIALMLAQRFPSAQVLGVDIDEASVAEASKNAKASPSASRVSFQEADIRQFAVDDMFAASFSHIVCNPPYYTEDTLPPDTRRSKARNAVHLTFAELLDAVCRLLAEGGTFAVVIPMQARDEFVSEAMLHHLHLHRECRVRTVDRKAPKRVLLEFCNGVSIPYFLESLTLQTPDGNRTEEYASLCWDFYL